MYASSQFHLKSGTCSSLVPSPYYHLQYKYKFSPGISPLFVLQAMIVVVEEATCAAYVYTTISVGTNHPVDTLAYDRYFICIYNTTTTVGTNHPVDTLAYDRYFIYQWIQIGLY